jgi:hypothetical protein
MLAFVPVPYRTTFCRMPSATETTLGSTTSSPSDFASKIV